MDHFAAAPSVIQPEPLARSWYVNRLHLNAPPLSLLALLIIISLSVPIIAEVLLDRGFLHQSLFSLANYAGPTTQSLLNGQGIVFRLDDLGLPGNTVFFHAGRMPMTSLVIALGIRLFGNNFSSVALFKTALFLVPLQLCMYLVWRRMPASPLRRLAITLLLLAPFAVRPFLAQTVNLQVEEGYSYSILALGVAVLLFAPYGHQREGVARASTALPSAWHIVFYAFVVSALYLTKSSMAPAAAALSIAFFLHLRSPANRLFFLLLVIVAPVSWAVHQYHASGRLSLGTSLDGLNLHKGNNQAFLDNYPSPQVPLDDHDVELNRGHRFRDEWEFDSYHRRAAAEYLFTHPRQIIAAAWRKFDILSLSLTKYGSVPTYGLAHKVDLAGMLLVRCLFWASVVFALATFFTRAENSLRSAAEVYLAIVAACVLPYLVGFAYTRHGMVLAYPASLMCCRFLCTPAAEK